MSCLRFNLNRFISLVLVYWILFVWKLANVCKKQNIRNWQKEKNGKEKQLNCVCVCVWPKSPIKISPCIFCHVNVGFNVCVFHTIIKTTQRRRIIIKYNKITQQKQHQYAVVVFGKTSAVLPSCVPKSVHKIVFILRSYVLVCECFYFTYKTLFNIWGKK